MSEFTRWAAASSTGRVRQINEDAAYAGRWLHAIADGMGGHVAGEIASAAAITALASYDAPPDPADLARILAVAVSDANAAIRRRTEADPALRSMGTTLTAMLWAGRTFGLAHIGDSRAYRLRGGQLRQLTEDHALGNLVAGASPALAPVMSRYLDGRPDRSPDLMIREAMPGDRYLLCSDGLSSVVPDNTMRDALASIDDSELIVERLISLANSFGGPDNTTVILIDVAAEPQECASPPVMLGATAVQQETSSGTLYPIRGTGSSAPGRRPAHHRLAAAKFARRLAGEPGSGAGRWGRATVDVQSQAGPNHLGLISQTPCL